jgi:hypothetical protein
MRTALALLAAATVLVTPNLFGAQSVTRTDIHESQGELTADVQLHMSRGDASSSQLRFATAAREYRLAADIARREGHLPSGTTWKLANAYFNDENLLSAAAALDQLATDAALIGDLPVEALAIFNSAWLNGKAGRKSETAARVARLEGLLRSPYMPVAIRDHLSGLLKTSRELAVVVD